MAKTKAELAKEKAELVAKAVALGIDVAGKNVKQLAAASEQASIGGDGHAPQPGEPEVTGKVKGATMAHVTWEDGVRTYSKDEHGADWEANAGEFASKREGRSIEFE